MKLSYHQVKYFHFNLTPIDDFLELGEFWSTKCTSYQLAQVLLSHKMKLAPASVNLPLNKPVCRIWKDKPQKLREQTPSFINILVKHKWGETTRYLIWSHVGLCIRLYPLRCIQKEWGSWYRAPRKPNILVFLNNSSQILLHPNQESTIWIAIKTLLKSWSTFLHTSLVVTRVA